MCMDYRILGKTGLNISVIGLGCEGFSGKSVQYVKEMIDTARSYGINIIDLFSPDPDVRAFVGSAVSKNRADFIIQGHLCTFFENGEYTKTRDVSRTIESFEDLLARLQTDYIDIGMVHYVDSMSEYEEVFSGEIGAYLCGLKECGKVHYVGMSSHNAAVSLRAVLEGKIDVLMFSINPAYDLEDAETDIYAQMDFADFARDGVSADSLRAELYATCEARGVGITVMKAFAGGRLLSADMSPFCCALTPVQCISYALDRPGVVSVLCGCGSLEEIREDVAYCCAEGAERDYSSVFAECKKLQPSGQCMYCGHCAPCTSHIDIAQVTKLLDLAFMHDELPESLKAHYDVLAYHAVDCLECGQCELRCPFGVRIMENMRRAQRMFGGFN